MIKIYDIHNKLLGTIDGDKFTSVAEVTRQLVEKRYLSGYVQPSPADTGLVEYRIVPALSGTRMDFCIYVEDAHYQYGRLLSMEYVGG